MIKRFVNHIRRWNKWRKHNTNGMFHHILVLLGIIHSPTFEFTFIPEDFEKEYKEKKMKVPKIDWKPFNKDNPPADLCAEADYLILLREDNYDKGATWTYSVDIANPYGSYLDNFWNTTNDWCEGQLIEVLAYAELPYGLKEFDLEEVKDD